MYNINENYREFLKSKIQDVTVDRPGIAFSGSNWWSPFAPVD